MKERNLWLVRRILAREIETAYIARRGLVNNFGLDANPNSHVNDMDKVRLLREDKHIQIDIHLRDSVVNICQEMRYSHSDTDWIESEIFAVE